MMKLVSVCALSFALCGLGALAATPALAGVEKGKIDEPTYQSLHRSLPEAEKRINASDKDREEMAGAVRARNMEAVRTILMRNGVSERDLRGLEIRLEDATKRADAAVHHSNECRQPVTIRIRLIDHIYLIITIS
jgi:hypothetical protein